jgi:hypothetical protein
MERGLSRWSSMILIGPVVKIQASPPVYRMPSYPYILDKKRIISLLLDDPWMARIPKSNPGKSKIFKDFC